MAVARTATGSNLSSIICILWPRYQTYGKLYARKERLCTHDSEKVSSCKWHKYEAIKA